MAKRPDEKDVILITSFMKNISKEAIVRDVMNTFYKYHCVGMQLNGIDPKRKSKKDKMVSLWGVRYDSREKTFYLLGKKFMDYTFNYENGSIEIDCHLYNIHNGEKFSKEEIAELMKTAAVEKNDFSDVEKSLARALAEKFEDDEEAKDKKVTNKSSKHSITVKEDDEIEEEYDETQEKIEKWLGYIKRNKEDLHRQLENETNTNMIAYYKGQYFKETEIYIRNLHNLGYEYVDDEEI